MLQNTCIFRYTIYYIKKLIQVNQCDVQGCLNFQHNSYQCVSTVIIKHSTLTTIKTCFTKNKASLVIILSELNNEHSVHFENNIKPK